MIEQIEHEVLIRKLQGESLTFLKGMINDSIVTVTVMKGSDLKFIIVSEGYLKNINKTHNNYHKIHDSVADAINSIDYIYTDKQEYIDDIKKADIDGFISARILHSLNEFPRNTLFLNNI